MSPQCSEPLSSCVWGDSLASNPCAERARMLTMVAACVLDPVYGFCSNMGRRIGHSRSGSFSRTWPATFAPLLSACHSPMRSACSRNSMPAWDLTARRGLNTRHAPCAIQPLQLTGVRVLRKSCHTVQGLLRIFGGLGWQFWGDFGNFAPNFLNLLTSSLRDHVPSRGLGGEQSRPQ